MKKNCASLQNGLKKNSCTAVDRLRDFWEMKQPTDYFITVIISSLGLPTGYPILL